ncbi:MAG: hypothetical protein IT168_09825 [Bryobacterales bacterium]|nr:hypothetical protein [Bryobacterales bacterium]
MRWRVVLLSVGLASSQTFTNRGFFDLRTTLYPQTASNDSGRVVSEGLLRWEPTVEFSPSLRVFTSVDARSDTHAQVERSPRFDWQDRKLLRPAFSLRRASVQYNRGGLTVEAGKQFIRWGKADILNPTDRFAPRDYLSVVDNDFLGVLAGRVTYEKSGNTIDAVVSRFTPSRTPLLNQRWTVLPDELSNVPLTDAGSLYPDRPQVGLRYNRVGAGYEFSTVFFDGSHHLPLFEGAGSSSGVTFSRYHPRLRLYGGDLAVPTKLFTIKGEAAYFTSDTKTADAYVLWVLQLERTWGEWVFVGGYAGEAVTNQRNPLAFAPDRGFARSALIRAAYTIDARRSFAVETAIRDSGDGVWIKGEYSHQLSGHWRATASFTLIRGSRPDFLGQFHRNSHGVVLLRYSF